MSLSFVSEDDLELFSLLVRVTYNHSLMVDFFFFFGKRKIIILYGLVKKIDDIYTQLDGRIDFLVRTKLKELQDKNKHSRTDLIEAQNLGSESIILPLMVIYK